jgi:hypothetical protein
MTHYHVAWGPMGSKNPANVEHFQDIGKALDRFIEVGQFIEAAEKHPDLPSTRQQCNIAGMDITMLVSYQTMICYCVCNNNCKENESPFDEPAEESN